LREQSRFLIELQKEELAAARITTKKKDLPVALAELSDEFHAANTLLEQEKEKLNELQQRHREKEGKLKSAQELAKRTRDRLTEVKTNKEYQAILKEIEAIEKKKSDTEDEIIACLEEMDQVEKIEKVRVKDFEATFQRYEQERRSLEEEIRNLDSDMLTVQQKIHTLRRHIRPDILKKYETIKGLRNGLAVVSVWKEVCNGCHMNLPPQLYIELQKSFELHTCPNCNRIIYWHNQEKHD
jgi:uncharacterized protein